MRHQQDPCHERRAVERGGAQASYRHACGQFETGCATCGAGICLPEAGRRSVTIAVSNRPNLARHTPQHNITLLLEPISVIPRYFMSHYKYAREVIDIVASPRVKYQCVSRHSMILILRPVHSCQPAPASQPYHPRIMPRVW